VFNTPLADSEKDSYIPEGITRARKGELNAAMDLVVAVRDVFQCASPTYPKNQCQEVAEVGGIGTDARLRTFGSIERGW
jgi:hypothetical protein